MAPAQNPVNTQGIILLFSGTITACVSGALYFMSRLYYKESSIIRSTNNTYICNLQRDVPQYVKLNGIVTCEQPLISPLAGVQCAMFSAKKIRLVEEKTKVKTKKQNKSIKEDKSKEKSEQTVDDEIWKRKEEVVTNTNNFDYKWYLFDKTGRVQVIGAEKAKYFSLKKVYDQYEDVDKQVEVFSTRRTIGYKTTEHVLPLNQRLFCMGEVVVDPYDGEFILRKPTKNTLRDKSTKNRPFIVTCESEDDLLERIESTGRLFEIGSILSGIISGLTIIWGFSRFSKTR